jgi:signal transduction histidine kinase
MPAPHPEPVNLNQVVQEVAHLFDAQMQAVDRPRIVKVLQLDDNLPLVPADPEQIRRALRNLVLNALDAMPNGGTLTLRTQRLDGPVDRKVALEVSDTGAGLTPEECARLFTPYYTTKQHGTGLGLAIVQSVVSDHEGTITVRSEPSKGATFRIELRA